MAINKDKVRAAAQKYLQKGQIDKAIREFQRLVEADPKDVRTLLKIGDLQTRAGATQEATETYARVAAFYAEQGFFLKAVAVYKQILKIDGSLIDVNQKLADLYRQLGLTSDAVAQYRQLAILHERRGHVDEARRVLEALLELEPNNLPARVKLAEIRASTGDRKGACAQFREVAAQLKGQGRIEDYVKVAERIVHFDPADFDTARELAEYYIRKSDARRALAKLQVCFKANPRDKATLELLGQAFQALGQTVKTLSVYRELARIYREEGAQKAYRATLQRILELSPNDAEARQAIEAIDRSAPAPDEDRSASEPPPASPSHQEASSAQAPSREERIVKLLSEAEVYVKYGLVPKAVDHLRKVFELDPDHRETRLKLRDLLLETGDTSGAAEQLWSLAQAALRAGDERRALGDLDALLEIQPDHVEARALKATLAGVTERPAAEPAVAAPPPPEPELPDETHAGAVDVAAQGEEDELDVDVEVEVDVDFEDTEDVALEAGGLEEEAPPSTTGGHPPLEDELEEVHFFVQQGLEDEARESLAHLLDAHPGHPELQALAEELGLVEGVSPDAPPTPEADVGAPPTPGAPGAEEPPLEEGVQSAAPAELDEDEIPEPETIAFETLDLGAELAADLGDLSDEEEGFTVADVFEQFKRGVAEQVEETDFDTHYNLGIAYKEMGLFADAIREFELARRDPTRALGAITMVGLCHIEQGEPERAVDLFTEALEHHAREESAAIALRYELGRAYLAAGRPTEAAALLQEVFDRDPDFRDVGQQLALARGDGAGDGRRDNGKISYV